MELEKIEMLFKSSNKDDWKYAQKVCHALKRDYYVISYRTLIPLAHNKYRRNFIVYYTLHKPEDLAGEILKRLNLGRSKEEFIKSGIWKRMKLHKIKLNKNGRKINEAE